MGLECVMLLADNSSYSLNGDYGSSTRWSSQEDAIRVVFNQKTGVNPESSVGLMTMAGSGPTVLVSPTREFGKVASALHTVKMNGQSDIITGINVAQLALKHRQNKNQRQRIIVFVGSPMDNPSTASELVKLGKKLKKNNVAVDIVSFGEDAENEEQLRGFVDAVNSSDNSRLVSVPAGTVLLSDMIISSGMLSEDGVPPQASAGPSGTNGAGNDEDGEFGVDPGLDPELAMALRMSLDEERARQAAARQSEQAAQASTTPTAPSESTSTPAPEASTSSSSASQGVSATQLRPALSAKAATGPAQAQVLDPSPAAAPTASVIKQEETEPFLGDEDVSMTEDEELAMALALSRGQDEEMGDGNNQDVDDGDDDEEDEGLTEEEAIARAIAMSMKEQQPGGQ